MHELLELRTLLTARILGTLRITEFGVVGWEVGLGCALGEPSVDGLRMLAATAQDVAKRADFNSTKMSKSFARSILRRPVGLPIQEVETHMWSRFS